MPAPCWEPCRGAWAHGQQLCAHCGPQPHVIVLVGEGLSRSSGSLLHSCTKLLRALANKGWSTPWTERPQAGCRALSGPSSCFLGLKHPLHHKGTGGPVNEVGTLANTTDPTRQLPSWHQPSIAESQSRWAAMVCLGSSNLPSFNMKGEAVCLRGWRGFWCRHNDHFSGISTLASWCRMGPGCRQRYHHIMCWAEAVGRGFPSVVTTGVVPGPVDVLWARTFSRSVSLNDLHNGSHPWHQGPLAGWQGEAVSGNCNSGLPEAGIQNGSGEWHQKPVCLPLLTRGPRIVT